MEMLHFIVLDLLFSCLNFIDSFNYTYQLMYILNTVYINCERFDLKQVLIETRILSSRCMKYYCIDQLSQDSKKIQDIKRNLSYFDIKKCVYLFEIGFDYVSNIQDILLSVDHTHRY